MTPTLSVDAVHDRLIWVLEAAVALRPVGTDGGVVSEPAALNATTCMTQPLLFCVAVAAYEPRAVTVLSSVRLPKAVERVVKPVPAWVTSLFDAPAPKMRSLGVVVVAVPLLIALVVPTAAAVTSNGLTLSIPEYSWM